MTLTPGALPAVVLSIEITFKFSAVNEQSCVHGIVVLKLRLKTQAMEQIVEAWVAAQRIVSGIDFQGR